MSQLTVPHGLARNWEKTKSNKTKSENTTKTVCFVSLLSQKPRERESSRAGMQNVAALATLLLAALTLHGPVVDTHSLDGEETDEGRHAWCYYCNWTTPDDVYTCKDMSAQCIRCNDPLVACIGRSCFRHVAHNGNAYTLSCIIIIIIFLLYCFILSFYLLFYKCLQCFDAVGWAAGRASGL